MSILKALQKKQIEQTAEAPEAAPASQVASTPTATPASTVVPFERDVKRVTTPPEMFVDEAFKIGTPSSAFNGQIEDLVGTALPETTSIINAGATLNAIGAARSGAIRLPEFSVWTVEPERVEPRLVSITQPNSNYCEEYRNLRTQILHRSQRQKLQSIVVASINPGEGKTVTALNLSWLLAQTDGIRCLIIDSDLRMPSLTDYLGIETDRGLSDILAGRADLEDSIIKLNPAGLYVLPGGEARSDVAELISGPKFKEILRKAREMFDFVIIDAPPLGIFTDANILINHADGAMLVIRAGRTRYGTIDRILESVPRDRMLGTVLNHSEDVLNETQYGYGYYKKR